MIISSILPQVTEAVTRASRMLCDEARCPEGVRGFGDKAEIDIEIEEYLANVLTSILPARFVGEETAVRPGDGNFCWLVDPQDGTRAFLEGHRGSSVSVALLRDGVPVLGVVCAPMSPDRGWDLIAWAEGAAHLLRNGAEVKVDLSRAKLEAGAIVFLNHGTMMAPVSWGRVVAPARFVSFPSIAYRLARVAAGDGVVAASFHPLGGLDYAAGHALLRGVGGVVLDEAGREATYGVDGTGRIGSCFGGAPEAARDLARRSWSRGDEPPRRNTRLSWPRVRSDDEVDRAKGCLFGQLIGDNLGGLVEFMSEEEIACLYPNGVRDLVDGGAWNLLAGQGTDDSELALALARTLVATKNYDADSVVASYSDWLASGPFDVGETTRKAFSKAGAADHGSQANGSLMRVSPIGIWGRSPELADRYARVDSRLSHPNEVCVDACGVFAAAIAEGIRTGSRDAMFRVAGNHVQTDQVRQTLERAGKGEAPWIYQDGSNIGWVLIALQNAFYQLRHAENFEEALVLTVGKGGDTDTNAAIAGALLGAAYGMDAIPGRWTMKVQACRPHGALGARQPRPVFYWPDDLAALAESLLVAMPPCVS